MSLGRWQKLSSEVFHENKWWKGVHDRFRLPNGKEGDYFYMKTPGSVFVVPVDKEGKIVLIRQYRYLADKESLEFVAGGVKPGQTTEDTALAELLEEVGARAGELKEIGSFEPCNGLIKEACHVFIAGDLEFSEANPEETESIKIERYSFEETDKIFSSGEVWDGMALAAWTLAKSHLIKKFVGS